MLTDQRQIRFPPDALRAAIGASPAAAAALGLPPMKPQEVRLWAETNKVEVVFQTPGGLRSVKLDLLPLAALLMSFCFRANIPLPRKARKSARIDGGTLTLDFSMDFEPSLVELRPEVAMTSTGAAKPLAWGSGGKPV